MEKITRVVVSDFVIDFPSFMQAIEWSYELISEGNYSLFSMFPIDTDGSDYHPDRLKKIGTFSTTRFAANLQAQYGSYLEDCPLSRLLDLIQILIDEARIGDFENCEIIPFLAQVLMERRKRHVSEID